MRTLLWEVDQCLVKLLRAMSYRRFQDILSLSDWFQAFGNKFLLLFHRLHDLCLLFCLDRLVPIAQRFHLLRFFELRLRLRELRHSPFFQKFN